MIARLAESLKGDWKTLAIKLGYKDSEVCTCRIINFINSKYICVNFLNYFEN